MDFLKPVLMFGPQFDYRVFTIKEPNMCERCGCTSRVGTDDIDTLDTLEFTLERIAEPIVLADRIRRIDGVREIRWNDERMTVRHLQTADDTVKQMVRTARQTSNRIAVH